MGIALVLLALTIAVGCFSLDFADGSIRCSSDVPPQCPTSHVCVNGYCWSRAPLDAGADAAAAD
jgi:hypothetical protein